MASASSPLTSFVFTAATALAASVSRTSNIFDVFAWTSPFAATVFAARLAANTAASPTSTVASMRAKSTSGASGSASMRARSASTAIAPLRAL